MTTKPDPKKILRQAAVKVPAAAITFGLGYGIARTALEGILSSDPASGAVVKYVAPAALGAAAAYAGHQAHKKLIEEIKK